MKSVHSISASGAEKATETDYKEQPKHLGEQPVRRVVCSLGSFSLGGLKPAFSEQQGVTFSICQNNHYATFYNNNWGIARYAVYKITPSQARADRVQRPNDPWKPTKNPGNMIIRQGSNDLYKNQPNQGEYERGHLVPVDILSYSDDSVLATFTYTNCVPQIANFNKGQWKKYEKKIVKYASSVCSLKGGTLYLITGTSKVQFKEKLNPQGEITGVDTTVKPMGFFHDNVNRNPNLGSKIAIPNSMWTVGCCWNAKNRVVGAFGVMGTNSLNKPLNKFMMPKQSVAYVERVLKLEDPKITLFHDDNCYAQGKNVALVNIPD
ncbi:uncharacterized protein LOC111345553 isoform X2 [Stylophora pistillata]|uniref:uncharacterized protein LOC111345553 isoform X2 n=1 Tax=Stylophora pistillata TaxID=50429 RepID=UPI000C040CC8|nr:uncharacterized protein LOC111345553 isoform X2 [Stylophora pistillata]